MSVCILVCTPHSNINGQILTKDQTFQSHSHFFVTNLKLLKNTVPNVFSVHTLVNENIAEWVECRKKVEKQGERFHIKP